MCLYIRMLCVFSIRVHLNYCIRIPPAIFDTMVFRIHTFFNLCSRDGRIRLHIFIYIYTYIYTYLHTYIHRYMHTYIHTYEDVGSLSEKASGFATFAIQKRFEAGNDNTTDDSLPLIQSPFSLQTLCFLLLHPTGANVLQPNAKIPLAHVV